MSIGNVGWMSLLIVALALAAAPSALGANPPKGSHGQETDAPAAPSAIGVTAPKGSHGQERDAPAATTPALYSRAVTQVCANARLFEQPHSVGTRTGALEVAGDIRASTQRRLTLVATVPVLPAQRATVTRWLALEQRLADTYALAYVRIYDLIAAPRTEQQDTQAARRLASLMHAPARLRRAAARLERQLRVPDCTGG